MKSIIIIAIASVFLFVPIGVYADTTTIRMATGSGVPGCEKITDGCFIPDIENISPGDSIIWKNTDSAPHTVSGGNPNDGPSGVFDSGVMKPNSSYTFTFQDEGEYDYFCMLHPWMAGIVQVDEKLSSTQSIYTIQNDPNKLDWAIIFVTSTNKCYSNHEQALDFYDGLTEQYLDKFDFSQNPVYTKCITKKLMTEAVNILTKSVDLTIVIPDYLMSVQDRHTTNSLGHYGYWNVKTIVSQAETLLTENRNTGWTLSHELAHFALDWKGYNNDIMGDAVHEVQRQYNSCKSYDTTLTNCTELWDVIKTPSNIAFPVMSQDYVIQVAEYMKPQPAPSASDSSEPTCPSGTVLKNGICTVIEEPKSVQRKSLEIIWITKSTELVSEDGILISGELRGEGKNGLEYETRSGKTVSIYNNGFLEKQVVTDSQGIFRYSWESVMGNNQFTANIARSDEWVGIVSQGPIISVKEKPTPVIPVTKYSTKLTLHSSVNEITEGETMFFYGQLIYYCNEKDSCSKGFPIDEKVKIRDKNKYLFESSYLAVEIGEGYTTNDDVYGYGSFKIPWTALKQTGMTFDGGSYWNPVVYYNGDTYQPTSAHGSTITVYDKPSFEYDNNISMIDLRIVDAFGNEFSNIKVDQWIQIAVDVVNNNNFSQDVVIQYAIRETGDDGSVISGSLSPDQSFTPAISWTPPYSGTFTIDVHIFDNIEDKNKLSDSLTKQIIVTDKIDSKIITSSNVENTIGEAFWFEREYPVSGVGHVRIIDEDRDINPEIKESFKVDVWSDSDPRGIELIVTESYKSTGIFEGTVFFTTSEESSSPKLKVAVGDTLTMEYEDRTLPEQYTSREKLDVTSTTQMIDPICDNDAVLIDHVCQVEKIKETETTCFLWWCW